MTWAALATLPLAPFAGVLLWLVVLRHVALAPGADDLRVTTAQGAAPVLAWARRLRAPPPVGREAAWRAAVELGAVGVAAWSLAALPAERVWPSCALGWLLLAASTIDARERILPDEINLAVAALGLLDSLAAPDRSFTDALIGAVAGISAFSLFSVLYAHLRGREGLGLGDAKLLGALGAWVGWQGLAGVVMVGAGTGLVWAVADAALRRKPLRADVSLPMGPFLALGGWLVWLEGPIGLGGRP